MKAVFFYILIACTTIVFSTAVLPVFAQQKDTAAQQVSNGINARKFTFTAQTASPQSGRLIQLTSPYDIRIGSDTIVSYLPYFGRAYVAPINTQDAGLEFTSVGFSYEVDKGKKDEWDVAIKTKDLRDNYTLLFTIYNNGQAQLLVSSSNRQPIRFDGYVVAKKDK